MILEKKTTFNATLRSYSYPYLKLTIPVKNIQELNLKHLEKVKVTITKNIEKDFIFHTFKKGVNEAKKKR